MAQEDQGLIQETEKKPVSKLLAFIVICCFLQFFIVALISVIRGYTTDTKLSDVVFLVGVLFVLRLQFFPVQRRYSIVVYLLSFWVIYSISLSECHGDYVKKGDLYYSSGRYREALQAFEKEVETWYFRLRYNQYEDNAMHMVAKAYCQLEDFDNARNTYKVIADRYPDYYSDRAAKDLIRLENGLKVVAKYPDQMPEVEGFPSAFFDIARTYQYDLNCNTKALEVYRKIIDMDIHDEYKKLARSLMMFLPERGDREEAGE